MTPSDRNPCTFGADSSPLLHPGSISAASRRDFLIRNGIGFGGLSLASLFGLNPFDLQGGSAPVGMLSPKAGHFPAKTKAVIQIFAAGAPSTVDTWDPKPELTKNDGKKIPGYEGLALGSPFKFEKKGKSGVEVSEIFAELGNHVDEMAIIRSLYAEIPDHNIASKVLMTGSPQLNKPCLGSWSVYGLGTVNQNLPGFISLGGPAAVRQAAFLPGIYQGCNVNYDPQAPLKQILPNITSQFSTADRQREQIDLAKELNSMHAAQLQKDAQLEARIQAFEIAFKMQQEAMDAFDISKEPQSIRDMYQKGGGKGKAGAKLLVARRLIERGVRFVQVTVPNWDTHFDIANTIREAAETIDGPAAALLTDLKQRGLLDSTLVIWGGEFGRTPTAAASTNGPGRDHNGRAMCAWMAGGGVRGGITYGATDEFGGRAVENKMHVHDLHATILALMGLDHTRLTYNYNGRDFRLTDNFGTVVKDLIA
ncbi:MAG: DUF1501 domain-containing protein [Verrucomicrobiota bacterium]